MVLKLRVFVAISNLFPFEEIKVLLICSITML